MALPINIISESDFVGVFNLYKPLNSKINLYVEQFAPSLLNKLFGAELAKEVIANRNTTDVNSKYYPLINGVGDFINLKFALLGFVWFEYVSDDQFRQTGSGTKKPKSETNEDASLSSSIVYPKYNYSVRQWNFCIDYIEANLHLYPNFKGQKQKLNTWL